MATDIVFNLYDLLVVNIFGSIGMAIIAMAAILAVILLLCRTSMTFLTYWMIFYFTVMGTLYLGALGIVIAFILSAGIIMWNIINITFRES